MVSWMSWKLGIMFGGGSWPACRQLKDVFQQRYACINRRQIASKCQASFSRIILARKHLRRQGLASTLQATLQLLRGWHADGKARHAFSS